MCCEIHYLVGCRGRPKGGGSGGNTQRVATSQHTHILTLSNIHVWTYMYMYISTCVHESVCEGVRV